MVRRGSRALVSLSAIFLSAACTAQPPAASSAALSRASQTPAPTSEPTATPAVTPAPTLVPTSASGIPEAIDLTTFSNPTTIDNAYFPLVPWQRKTFTGAATIDGERLSRKVVLTITDLTKEIAGVRAVVAYEVDYTDGVLGEAEIVLWAQDDAGVVWRMGEYPEVIEDGELVETPVWIHGFEDALAGIAMLADPQPDTPSYAQGWGPNVGWNDRGRIVEIGSKTCVRAGCYEDVLVIDEFNPDEPDARQTKYFAKGVGGVRVGFAGALEEEKEVLTLIKIETLSVEAQQRVRAQVLAQDARGYTTNPNVYGKTPPIVAPAG